MRRIYRGIRVRQHHSHRLGLIWPKRLLARSREKDLVSPLLVALVALFIAGVAGSIIPVRTACAQFQSIVGKAGPLGPDLSRIGAARSTQYLIDSIREPSKNLAEETTDPNFEVPVVYDTVTVVTNDGRRVSGVAKNEDAFSLQLMDQGEKLHFFSQRDGKEVI